jgi:hypothetical protein
MSTKSVTVNAKYPTIEFTLLRGVDTSSKIPTANILFEPTGSPQLKLCKGVEEDARVTFAFPRISSMDDLNKLVAEFPEIEFFAHLQKKLSSKFTQRNYPKLRQLSIPLKKYTLAEIETSLKPSTATRGKRGKSDSYRACEKAVKAAGRLSEDVAAAVLDGLRGKFPTEMAELEASNG